MSSGVRSFFVVLVLLALAAPAGAASDSFVIRDIRVEGLQRMSAGTVFNYLPVSVGDTMDTEKSAEVIRALYKTGFFKDVRLQREGDVLILSVQERPAIAKIEIRGNKDIETDALTQALKDIGLAEGRVFNRSVLDKIEQELQRQYFNRGKYGVKIETTVTPLERNRVAVDIDIVEGKAARIKQINIIGNTTFPEDDLLDEFQLRTTNLFSFYTRNDQYSKQKLAGDLETLRSYYLDRGYIKFAIESAQVSITPDKKDIFITIVISEGPVYTVSDVKIAGDLVVEADELFPLIRVHRGESFSRKKTATSSEELSLLLSNRGYAFANINSIPEIDEENRQVALTFFVDPGKRVYVRRINMLGNTRTRDEVLRREMRQMEAAWFSTSKVNESRDRLRRLGYFEDVSIETPAVPGSADEVDVNVTVKEKPSGNFLAGVGYSQSDGFILNTSITQENFLGTGKRVSLAFNNSSAVTIYRLAYTNPYYTVNGVSRGFDFSYRATDFAEYNSADYVTDIGRAGVNFGFPISPFSQANMFLDFEHINLKPGAFASDEITYFVEQNGTKFNDFNITADWSYDSRDSSVFPTRGFYNSLVGEMTVPGSDLQFYKLRYRLQKFWPLTRDLTLMLRGDLGYGNGYGSTDSLPFFFNYFAGGMRSVRGFEQYSLGPQDSQGDPIGGNLLTTGGLELILPAPLEGFENTVRISGFVDAGNVFQTFDYPFASDQGFKLDEIRYSVGVGATWLSPVGALAVSLAYPLNAKSFDNTEYFQFSFGTGF